MALGPTDYRGAMAGRQPSMRPQTTGTAPDMAVSRTNRPPKTVATTPVARPKALGTAPDAMPLTAAIARTGSAPSASPDVTNAAVSPAARPRLMKEGGLVRKGNVSKGPYSKKC